MYVYIVVIKASTSLRCLKRQMFEGTSQPHVRLSNIGPWWGFLSKRRPHFALGCSAFCSVSLAKSGGSYADLHEAQRSIAFSHGILALGVVSY